MSLQHHLTSTAAVAALFLCSSSFNALNASVLFKLKVLPRRGQSYAQPPNVENLALC